MEIDLFRGFERLIVTACAPLLLFIGYRLFVLGASGTIEVFGKSESGELKISNLSPGAFCFFLGVALGGVVMMQKAELDYQFNNDGKPSRLIASFLGGDGGGTPSLSGLVAQTYMRAGLCMEEVLGRNLSAAEIQKQHIEDCLQPARTNLRKPLTRVIFKEIAEAELAAASGDSEAITRYNAYMRDYPRRQR